MENNAELNTNKNVSLPEDLKKWNLGAFSLNFIWGIVNKVYFSLLVFIPIVGIIAAIILGIKGNEWAWKKNEWTSVEEFKACQKRWNIAGLIVVIFSIIIFTVLILSIFLFSLKEPIDKSLEILNRDTEAVEYLGNNIKLKVPLFSGGMSFGRNDADARLSILVKGEKGEANVFIIAKRRMSIWNIESLIFQPKGGNDRFDLLEND